MSDTIAPGYEPIRPADGNEMYVGHWGRPYKSVEPGYAVFNESTISHIGEYLGYTEPLHIDLVQVAALASVEFELVELAQTDISEEDFATAFGEAQDIADWIITYDDFDAVKAMADAYFRDALPLELDRIVEDELAHDPFYEYL